MWETDCAEDLFGKAELMQTPFSHWNLGPTVKGVGAMPALQDVFGEHVCTGRLYGTPSMRRNHTQMLTDACAHGRVRSL